METLTTNLDSANTLSTTEAAFVGSFVGVFAVVSIIFAVLVIIGQWKIFEKAGEKGWKSLIPIYGQYILFKISGAKAWFWVLFCTTIIGSIMMGVNSVPVNLSATQAEINAQLGLINWGNYVPYLIGAIVTMAIGIAANIALCIKLAKAFGKGLAYILGLIFFPQIVMMVLGFGKAKYNKKAVK